MPNHNNNSASEYSLRKQRVLAATQHMHDGSVRCSGLTAILDSNLWHTRFAASSENAADAMQLRRAFSWHCSVPPYMTGHIQCDSDTIVSHDEAMAAFDRIEARRIVHSKELQKISLPLITRRVVSFTVAGWLTFGVCWVGGLHATEEILEAWGGSGRWIFWMKSIGGALLGGPAHQFMFPFFGSLEVLYGGKLEAGQRGGQTPFTQFCVAVLGEDVGAIVALGLVVAVVAIYEPESKGSEVAINIMKFAPGFTAWAIWSIVMEWVVTRRPMIVELPHKEDERRSLGAKVGLAGRDAWYKVIGGGDARRHVVQILVKCLVLMMVPLTSEGVSRMITDRATVEGASGGDRFGHMIVFNTCFVLEFLVVGIRVLSAVILVVKYDLFFGNRVPHAQYRVIQV